MVLAEASAESRRPLEGRRAVVTGASQGIGLAIARTLLSNGATVVAAARHTSPALAELAQDARMLVVNVDLGTAAGATRLCLRAAEAGSPDILVNNVGGPRSTEHGGFLSVTDEDWLQTMTLNVLSAVRMSRLLLPAMVAGDGGAIINISSILGRGPFVRAPDYAAMKAAMRSLTKSLSEEFARFGVRVNTVSPGVINSPSWERPDSTASAMALRLGIQQAELAQVLPRKLGISIGRMGTSQDVADAVAFLASDAAAYITGTELVVDGGADKGL